MSIGLIDTSVFLNILDVPNKNQNHAVVVAQLKKYILGRFTLLLPMATIFETGNHISQNGDGSQRRQTAQRFVKQVSDAIDGTAPWVATPFIDREDLKAWLVNFPDHAMRGSSLGDLSILGEFERQCKLHPGRHVFVWSLDEHLASYQQAAKTGKLR